MVKYLSSLLTVPNGEGQQNMKVVLKNCSANRAAIYQPAVAHN